MPPVPLLKLSNQQRTIYNLAANHSTREISQILSIPEKQVRQVYSAIRSKSREFANKNVHNAAGAKPAHLETSPEEADCCGYDLDSDLPGKNSIRKLTESELLVLEHVKKGLPIKEIAELTGKSIQSITKTHQRAKKKLCRNDGFYDDNCIIKVDTGKTQVRINCSLIKSAMDRMNLTIHQVSGSTGILPERLDEIQKSGILSYDELFLLIRHLKLNPYGPAEKDELLKKIKDTQLIRLIREGSICGRQSLYAVLRKRLYRDKSRYRNKVMYFGTAYYRYSSASLGGPVVEDGRNGMFPVQFTRDQLAECGWLLKKLMIRPVYTYRYPGLAGELMRLERILADEKDGVRADRYCREMQHLKEDIAAEDGSSIFIMNKNQLMAVNKVLFGS